MPLSNFQTFLNDTFLSSICVVFVTCNFQIILNGILLCDFQNEYYTHVIDLTAKTNHLCVFLPYPNMIFSTNHMHCTLKSKK